MNFKYTQTFFFFPLKKLGQVISNWYGLLGQRRKYDYGVWTASF